MSCHLVLMNGGVFEQLGMKQRGSGHLRSPRTEVGRVRVYSERSEHYGRWDGLMKARAGKEGCEWQLKNSVLMLGRGGQACLGWEWRR